MRRLFVVGFLALAIVGCCCHGSLVKVSSVNEKVETETLSIKLERVSPWCDHMPLITEKGEAEPVRQYLALHVVLENKTDKLAWFQIERVYASFDVDKLGPSTNTLRMRDGRPVDVDGQEVLGPREKVTLTFICKGIFAEGNHGRRLYAAVRFVVGGIEQSKGQTILVRGMGEIIKTS